MRSSVDLSIVIPCFNEAENVDVLMSELQPVVAELRRGQSVEVICVDDGSLDGSGDLLETRFAGDSDLRVVRHERNRGLGAALRTGFQHARGEAVVTTDCDGTYPFTLIPALLDRLGENVDLVTASCYHPAGGVDNVPGYRVVLSRSASLLYRIMVSREIYTYTSMFRAYRRSVLQTVPFESDGYLAVTELLVNAIRMGHRVVELPCTLRVRRYGQSKAKVARIIRSHLRFQWSLLRSSAPRQGVRPDGEVNVRVEG